jgi:lipid-A-disaccharide synthase
MKKSPTILITCGETSGDLHAARLVTELKRKIPDANIIALGGDRVARAGARLLYHVDDYAIIGVSGVLTNLHRFARLERGLKQALANGVDLYIPVDYPGLNLRLASHAKKLGVPVLYYISPQIWAWGEGRLQKMVESVDFVAVILPFEEEIYRERGIPVEFVGHPFVEDHTLPDPRDQGQRTGIGLLPGSRSSEVRRILPILLETASHIQRERPDERFVVGMSRSVPRATYEKIVARHSLEVELASDSLEVMASSRLLLVASGTATLQGALFATPLIIVYRVNLFNYLIARRLVKIDHIGLVNIILGEEICPEFVQVEAKPQSIAEEAISLLKDTKARDSMVSKFGSLRRMLAGPGGTRRVAEISEQLLNAS